MITNGQCESAVELINEALGFSHPLWRVRLLRQLMVCYRKLGDTKGPASAAEQLDILLGESGGLEVGTVSSAAGYPMIAWVPLQDWEAS